MSKSITDGTLAGWVRVAAVLTGGTGADDGAGADPVVDRHPPYASGSFHDGWVRVCVADRELCRVAPDRDGYRRTEVAGAVAAAGPALYAAADEVLRLRARVAELERLTATTGRETWRHDPAEAVAGPSAWWPSAGSHAVAVGAAGEVGGWGAE